LKKLSSYLVITLLSLGQAFAQGEYNMTNTTVFDCEGFLLDSDAGNNENYDHDEDLTFSICISQANSITLLFSEFQTENKIDSIRFFDGPNINSPQIGSAYSGTTLPPAIVAGSGCLTVNFKSDASLSFSGFRARWEADIPDPIPPVITEFQGISCDENSFTVILDKNVHCDSIYNEIFSLIGTEAPQIILATALNCVGDSTNEITVRLANDFSANDSYLFTYIYRVRDECDSLWTFEVSNTFSLNDCPIRVTLTSSDPDNNICEGECFELLAAGEGGDPTTYRFTWLPNQPDSVGPFTFCPTVTTSYTVILNDATLADPDTAIYTMSVTPKPTTQGDTTVCQSSPAFDLLALPLGGLWSGKGVINAANGTFNPGLVGGGDFNIIYTASGCSDTMKISVKPISAGRNEAACIGSPPFNVSGHYPLGGTWSGPKITPTGTFTPDAQGVYVVTYTFDGCSDTKTIYVDDLNIQGADTLCQNDPTLFLTATPEAGVWSGPGITNQYTGEFQASLAGPGESKIYYIMQGCRDSVKIFVKPISAGVNEIKCPLQDTFLLTGFNPAGGIWKGIGITDTLLGEFFPGFKNGTNFDASISYSFDGCTALKIINVIKTDIPIDTLTFCASDDTLNLNFNKTGRKPNQGTWTGTGVIIDVSYKFIPSLAGPGNHVLYYTANTCVDSIVMAVYLDPILGNDTSLCLESPIFNLEESPRGGIWSGSPGLIDSNQGIFDPSLVSEGDHNLIYTAPANCPDTMVISVAPRKEIIFNGVNKGYCFINNNFKLRALPSGGIFTGKGVLTDSLFNPTQAGEGFHTLYYYYSGLFCDVFDSVKVYVAPPLLLEMSDTSKAVCYGTQITIGGFGSGGSNSDSIKFNWNNGLGDQTSYQVTPLSSVDYILTISDGCSDPISDTIKVTIHPEITATAFTSPIQCFGEIGFAEVSAQGPNDYGFKWQYSKSAINSKLEAPTGIYGIRITDLNTKCFKDTQFIIPGHPQVEAFFSTSPHNDRCVSFRDPRVNFIDNSIGGESGTWDFGDGSSLPYTLGENPLYAFTDTGIFQPNLKLINSAGCESEFTLELCIVPFTEIFGPNAFSPNNDGLNDVFFFSAYGTKELRLLIYNRWGELVYETNDPSENGGWDGTFKGEDMPEGVYLYKLLYSGLTETERGVQKGAIHLLR
jgi:gliding motility-associated-like protein